MRLSEIATVSKSQRLKPNSLPPCSIKNAHNLASLCASLAWCSVAISSLNQRKLSNPHPLAHSHLCYLVGDVTNLIPHFPSPISNSTIDLIFDKGCFDTFQFRAKSNSTDQLQTKLLSEVLRLLKPSGFYIIITPKKRLKNLNCLDGGGFSSVARKKMSSSGGVLDSLEQEAIYVYFCRKSDENATKFDDVDDVDDDDDDEEDQKTCPVCDAAWSEPRFLDKQKNWRRKWKNHLLWCRVNREKEAKKEQEKEQEEEQEKEHTTTIIEDPTTFWKQWSENQMNCQTHNDNINNICACFEGMGSVM